MCVITSMFFGLMASSEEIVRDRKILKRESFLNLSWFSYLNSKVLYNVPALGNTDLPLCLNRKSDSRDQRDVNYLLVCFIYHFMLCKHAGP